MDEPDGGCFWQAWKYGMKREDLYTKLQDQYNTVTLSIQDPDAFHHDVCEISQTAADSTEFHRLLEERKQLRLEQLNESLQSASVEIIANPELIGTDHWQHAIQLFRTKSFDSLVRYFSSYLPEDHEWNPVSDDSTSTRKSFFDGFDDTDSFMTHEPVSFITGSSINLIPTSHLPPSPRSLTMCSDSSKASTPSRTLSFSEPETDIMALSGTLTQDYDDETSQWDEPDTPTTPLSEISDMHPSEYAVGEKKGRNDDDDDSRDTSQQSSSLSPYDEDQPQDPSTPTPHQTSIEVQSSDEAPRDSVTNSIRTSKYTPLEQRVRETSPGLRRARRRSPDIGRIQKPSADTMRIRLESVRKAAGHDCSLTVKR